MSDLFNHPILTVRIHAGFNANVFLAGHHGNARHRAAPFLFGIQSTRQARKTAVPCAFTYNI